MRFPARLHRMRELRHLDAQLARHLDSPLLDDLALQADLALLHLRKPKRFTSIEAISHVLIGVFFADLFQR